jgi:hypothetical protein
VDSDKAAITGIVDYRREIATALRNILSSSATDEEKVRSAAREYGKLDGEISYDCAMAFSKIGQTLTTDQKEKMMNIRNLRDYPTEEGKMYLYSDKIDRPEIRETDFLFN